MAFINKGKHLEKEINGTRVRVVESAGSKERMEFLKELLTHNGYEVLVEENPPKPVPVVLVDGHGQESEKAEESAAQEPPEQEFLPASWLIGVTDVTFNPVVSVYQRNLRTLEGQHVTPDYFNQITREAEPNYWDLQKK